MPQLTASPSPSLKLLAFRAGAGRLLGLVLADATLGKIVGLGGSLGIYDQLGDYYLRINDLVMERGGPSLSPLRAMLDCQQDNAVTDMRGLEQEAIAAKESDDPAAPLRFMRRTIERRNAIANAMIETIDGLNALEPDGAAELEATSKLLDVEDLRVHVLNSRQMIRKIDKGLAEGEAGEEWKNV